uniref:G_PROTEIN_RECEP_F1_2 domain-containing protein n=1 Tax=Rhabditophanes sp. KR3021 TaxID=114890 RepID=A0AC35U5M4_9BILA
MDKVKQILEAFNEDQDTAGEKWFTVTALVVYAFLALFGLLGNLIFCLVIWKSEKLHTVTHMLMTNLAVCNLLFVLFHPPFFVTTYILQADWMFGTLLCKASSSIVYVTATGSFYFMSLVAIDRWLAIFYRRFRLDRSRCSWLTVIAWVISFGVSSPYLYYTNEVEFGQKALKDMRFDIEMMQSAKDISDSRRQCAIDCQHCHRILQLTTIVAQYCIPLAIMIPAYSHLAVYLWRRPTIGIQTREKCKKAQRRRRRMLITLLAIVGSLIVCWSPLFSVGVLHSYNFIDTDSLSLHIYTSMIALFGVVLTPCFYLLNDGFRQQIILFLPSLFPNLSNQNKQSSATGCDLSQIEKPNNKLSSNEEEMKPVLTPLLAQHSQSSRVSVAETYISTYILADTPLTAV